MLVLKKSEYADLHSRVIKLLIKLGDAWDPDRMVDGRTQKDAITSSVLNTDLQEAHKLANELSKYEVGG
jgi:hypothetical protein